MATGHNRVCDGIVSTSRNDGCLVFWRLSEKGKLEEINKLQFPDEVISLAFSPDGEVLYVATVKEGGSKLRFINTKTRKKIGKTRNIEGLRPILSVSSDSKYLLVGTVAPTIEKDNSLPNKISTLSLWDAKSNRLLSDFSKKFSKRIFDITFIPDTHRALVSSKGIVHLIDMKTKEEIASLSSSDTGESVIVTPEGYFDSTPEGTPLLYFLLDKSNEVFPSEQFASQLRRSDIIKSRLSGLDTIEAHAPIIQVPPTLRVLSPPQHAHNGYASLMIDMHSNIGLKEIKVYSGNSNIFFKEIVGKNKKLEI